jgi:abequosyltransferase
MPMSKPILTIAIPTYNRAKCLAVSLLQIKRQIKDLNNEVEVMVSDNNSTDNTEETVRIMISNGLNLRYIKNKENIGSDKNYFQCYQLAQGKYVLIMGDDDYFIDGALVRIMAVLKGGDYGIIHLKGYPLLGKLDVHQRLQNNLDIKEYSDKEAYVRSIHYFFTFSSANIFNKGLVNIPEKDINKYLDTRLVQLMWIFSALFNSQQNIIIETPTFNATQNNSGGFKICQVFGVNQNKIFQYFIKKQKIARKYFVLINQELLLSYLPYWLVSQRGLPKAGFIKENSFASLFPVFWGYLNFWKYTVPVIFLPRALAVKYNNKFINKIIKERNLKNLNK